MENVSFAKIEKNNPCVKSYLKKINKVEKGLQEELLPFYAIYLGDVYKAAMVINLEKENRKATIKMISFSAFDQEFIEKEATKKVTNLLNEKYNIDNVEINPVKVLSK